MSQATEPIAPPANSFEDVKQSVFAAATNEHEETGIGNIWEDIRERVSSPFIFSYVISWLVWNWSIVILLVKYDSTSVSKLGYQSLMAYITGNTNFVFTLVVPLLMAYLYTFYWPLVRDYIRVKSAQLKVETNKELAKISEDFQTPITKYMELKQRFMGAQETMGRLIVNESQAEKQRDALRAEQGVWKTKYREKDEKIAEWEQKYVSLSSQKFELITGIWDVQFPVDNHVER